MDKQNNDEEKDSKEKYEKFVSSSLFSILYNYSFVLTSIITIFILARLLSPSELGFILLATSIIKIITLISSFLPPSIGISLNYYVAKYRSQARYNKLKTMIQKAFLIKII